MVDPWYDTGLMSRGHSNSRVSSKFESMCHSNTLPQVAVCQLAILSMLLAPPLSKIPCWSRTMFAALCESTPNFCYQLCCFMAAYRGTGYKEDAPILL